MSKKKKSKVIRVPGELVDVVELQIAQLKKDRVEGVRSRLIQSLLAEVAS
jgi:hypothetical protein